MHSKTYSLVYHCSNCGATFNVEIPYGTPAPSSAQCTACGCMTGHRNWPSPCPDLPKRPYYPDWPRSRPILTILKDGPVSMARLYVRT